MPLPLMKQTLPNFIKLVVGRDPCQPKIDRAAEYRPGFLPKRTVEEQNCYDVLTPSVCTFSTKLLKFRTSETTGLDIVEVGCTLSPRPIWPLLINFLVLDFLSNKWVEHPLDKASKYREMYWNWLRFQQPVLDAFGRLPYSGIVDQVRRGAL